MSKQKVKWRDVVGYEEQYSVSSYGHVYSKLRPVTLYHGGQTLQKGRLRKAIPDKNRILRVILFKDNTEKQHAVHKLVLEAFVGPKPKNHWALHINGDLNDNRVENLRWGTPSEVFVKSDRRGEGNSRAKLSADQVLEIRRRYKHTKITQRKLAEEYGVSGHTVSDIITRKNWSHLPEEE